MDSKSPEVPYISVSFINKLDRMVSPDMSRKYLTDKVKDLLLSPEYSNITKEEYFILSQTGAVYIDSYFYWKDNMIYWKSILTSNPNLGTIRSLRGFWGDLWSDFKATVKDDAEGAATAAGMAMITAATGVGAPAAGGMIATGAAGKSLYGCCKRIMN